MCAILLVAEMAFADAKNANPMAWIFGSEDIGEIFEAANHIAHATLELTEIAAASSYLQQASETYQEMKRGMQSNQPLFDAFKQAIATVNKMKDDPNYGNVQYSNLHLYFLSSL